MPLSQEFVKQLLKKDDERMPGAAPIFTPKENSAIKSAVRHKSSELILRGKKFILTYTVRKKEDWVRMRPTGDRFVPMFSAPVNWVLDKEKEI
jgi:hypothetical protein